MSVRHEPAVVVASIPALIQRWVAHCTAAARAAQAARGRFSLAVPGGSVAERFLPPLVHADIDWSLVDVCFSDERCVPPLSGEANIALVEQHLRAPLGAMAPRVHRMSGEDPDPWRAARDYAATLRFLLGSPPVLDVALLGVGEDGHVASLFPGRPALYAADPPVLVEDAAPKLPPRRLTLSLEVLASAREVIVAAFGDAKAFAVAEALQDLTSELPLALLLRRANRATVMLDEDAASALGR
jgi:6-phosphogluconolactonase